jgi:hypothetical protein
MQEERVELARLRKEVRILADEREIELRSSATGGLSGVFYWYQTTNVWENEQLLRFTPREQWTRGHAAGRWRRWTTTSITSHYEGGQADHGRWRRGAARCARPDPGDRCALELWMLQQGRMSSMEALRAFTIDGARPSG